MLESPEPEILDELKRDISTREKEEVKLEFYPNPVREYLFLEINSDISTLVKIYDITGKEMYTRSFNRKTSINTTHWKKGIYVMKISAGSGEQFEQKVIVL